MGLIRDLLDVVEIRTKTVGLSSLLIGTGLAASGRALRGDPVLDVQLLALMLGATLCVDMGTTAWNSYGDWWRGTDDKRFNKEREKVLTHGKRTPGFALLVALFLYLGAFALGSWIAAVRGFEVVLVGLLGMAVGFLYSSGPKPLCTTPLGELFAGGFLGFALVALAYFVQAGSWATAPGGLPLWLEALPSGLFVASILTVNNTCDIEGDRAAGRRTLSILIGRPAADRLTLLLGLASWGIAFALALFRAEGGIGGLGPMVASASMLPCAALSLPVYLRMRARGYSHATKGPSMQAINAAFVLFSAARLLSILLG